MKQTMTQRNRSVSHKPDKSRQALTITHTNAAGMDIGSVSHYVVAVAPDRNDEPVPEFSSFTVDLNTLVDWLQACGVYTLATVAWNPPVCT